MVTTALPGPWLAHATSDELRRNFIESNFADASWLLVDVPGHWAHHDQLAARSSVLYRTQFTLSDDINGADTRHWLMLDGIWQSSDVWLDGRWRVVRSARPRPDPPPSSGARMVTVPQD